MASMRSMKVDAVGGMLQYRQQLCPMSVAISPATTQGQGVISVPSRPIEVGSMVETFVYDWYRR